MKLTNRKYIKNTVLHFLLDHRIGGPQVYVRTLNRFLPKDFNAVVFTTNRSTITDHSLLNIRHVHKLLFPFEVIVNFIQIILVLRSKLYDRRSAIFHVHGALNIAPLIAAFILRYPVLWLLHDTDPRLMIFVKIGRLFMCGSNKRICVVAKSTINAYGINNPIYISTGIDLDFWSRTACQLQTLDNSVTINEIVGVDRPLRLLCVGNINPLKGYDLLLDALYQFDLSTELIIVGAHLTTQNQYTFALQKSVEQILKINSKIEINFVGWEDDFSIRERLLHTDLFVLPSRSEACPIALLEAVSMGCFCIASDVGDVRTILKNYDASIIIPPNSSESILNAIQMYCDNYAQYNNIYKPRLSENWHIRELAKRTYGLYNKLMKR